MSITHTGERIFANDAEEGEAVRSVLFIPQEQVVDSTRNAERNRSTGDDGRGGGQSEALPDGAGDDAYRLHHGGRQGRGRRCRCSRSSRGWFFVSRSRVGCAGAVRRVVVFMLRAIQRSLRKVVLRLRRLFCAIQIHS